MKKRKQKVVSMAVYTKRLNAIIDKGCCVADTLQEMLEEAMKYQIKEKKK